MKKILFIAVLVSIAMPAKSQDSHDSVDDPISKKLGLAFFPLENKAGVAYCFGKYGNLKIEYNFKLPFSEIGTNIIFGQYSVVDELQLTYSWFGTESVKMYSGVAAQHKVIYFNVDERRYAFSPEIIPIGVELFPSDCVPGLSLIMESNYGYSYGIGGRLGLCFYF